MSDFIGYNLEKIIHFQLMQLNIKQQSTIWKTKKLLRLLFCFVFGGICLDYRGQENNILYADRFFKLREDIQKMLDNLMLTFDNHCDKLKWGKKSYFSLNRLFANIVLIYKTFRQLNSYSYSEKIVSLEIIIELNDLKRELDRKVPISKYNLCFCYYDAETFQNFIIQYAKLHGCKTATLQHGIMLAPRIGVFSNSDFDGHEFHDSVSDYFLMWNDFTKNEALKAGISEDKIRVLGVVKCLGVKKLKSNFDSIQIGIFLDGELERQNNVPLITIVQEWAKTHKKKCIFRYHPHFKGTEYADVIDESISTICDKSISLYDFIENVSFCVVANSTVLFELEYFCIPFLRYACDPVFDKYKDYPSIDFTSVNSFDEAYQKMIKMPPKKFVKADDNYASFFKQFLN